MHLRPGFRLAPLVLALSSASALPPAAPAQHGTTHQSTHRPQTQRSLSGYPGRQKLREKRIRRHEEELRRRANRPPTAPPSPPKLVNQPPTPKADKRYLRLHVGPPEPVVYPDHQKLLEKKREASGEAGGDAPAPAPATPPPAPSPRRTRSIRSPTLTLDGELGQELDRIRTLQRETNVRRRVREIAASGRAPTELALVQEVLRTRGAPVPGSPEDLATMGFEVPTSMLEPGDLVFFELEASSRHVAIYYGSGRFAYASRHGVRLGDLEEPRWRERLVTARRISAPGR